MSIWVRIPCSLGRVVEHSYNKRVFLRSESSSGGVGQSMDGGVGKELQLRKLTVQMYLRCVHLSALF